MSVEELFLSERNTATVGALNSLRKTGYVPGVMYGSGKDPVSISIQELSLMKTIETGSISKVLNVKFNDEEVRVIIKDVQFHPVTSRPMSVDFMRVQKGHRVNIKVRIQFLNENLSPAIKRGGVLNVAIHEALLSCDIDHVPQTLDVDVEHMDFHSPVKVGDLKIPEGARFVHLTKDLTVATIVAPSGLRSELGKEAKAEEAASSK